MSARGRTTSGRRTNSGRSTVTRKYAIRGADERPEARSDYRHADGLSDQQRPDFSDQHALGAQRDVLPPALQQKSEDEDRDRRGRHGQPISRVESEQAANVQRRET